MSKHYYSKSTRGFYVDDVHADSMPGDVIEIAENEYLLLISSQVDGVEIHPDESGYPRLVRSFEPTTVPSSVSRFQARAVLLQAGLLDDIETYMADPATDPFVRIAWQDAQVFRRNSPTVLSLQPLLGLTDGQLDDLFRFAATIEA